METRKRMIPKNSKGEPVNGVPEREYIFFKVSFNNFRETSGSLAHEVLDREVMEECEAVLCLPDSYTDDGEETQLIISCHGAGSTVCEERDHIGGLNYVHKCINAGYAALDISGAAPNGLTLGCPEHIFALYKAYKYVTRKYNLTKSVLLSGASMGGHVAMNFANTFPSIVTAIGIIYPRLNIDGVDVNGHYCIGTWDKVNNIGADGKNTRDRIVEWYHFPSGEWCEKNTIGFNPYRTRSFINSEGERVVIPPCPIKIWQGTDDKTVDPKMVEEYVNSIRRAGCYVEFHMIEGAVHKITDVMKQEQLLWFNRFL